MHAQRHILRIATFGLLGLSLVAADASAGDRHWRGYRAPDAEIDDLDAAIHFARGGWLLSVGFEIEVEDARPGAPLYLSIVVLDGKRPILDQWGRPLEILVPLDRPVEIDGDEIEFRDEVDFRVPDGLFSHPKNLRVLARIIDGPRGRVLDDDDEKVSFRRSRPRFNRHRGIDLRVRAAW